MTFEDARAVIYGRLNTSWSAAHPGMPVRYENRMAVDLGKEIDPFITCEILFNDGEQLGMGDNPGVRYEGAIYLSVWVKEDSGTAEALTYLGELATLFQMAVFGGVKTRACRPLPGRVQAGWYVLSLRVPMWFDQI
jgi:hypothetical protein